MILSGNLILDTAAEIWYCSGKISKIIRYRTQQNNPFAGLWDGNSVKGKLSLNNKVSIHAVIGEQIPIVVVPQQNLFFSLSKYSRVIGYDILIRFEGEIDPLDQLITFRPAATTSLSSSYNKVPLRIEDPRALLYFLAITTVNHATSS